MIRFIIPALLIIVPFVLIWTLDATWIIPAIIIDIVLAALSIRIVRPNTVMVVELFGKYNRTLRPGLHFIIPFIEWTRSQTLYRKNFPVEVNGITKDNVTSNIWLNVIYYVEDDEIDNRDGNIFKSIYNIDDPRTMMRSTIDEQLRAMIVNFTHKNIFEKREEIGQNIESRLRVKLSTFWYRLDSIQVRDISLESTVMAAMNKVVETEKLKEAALNEAEAEKIMKVKEAEAEKESKVLLWEGMAGQRMKIAEWFKESVDLIKQTDDSLNAEKVLDFLLDSSRIETLGSIWEHQNSKLIYLNEDLEWRKSKSREEKLIAWSDIMQ